MDEESKKGDAPKNGKDGEKMDIEFENKTN